MNIRMSLLAGAALSALAVAGAAAPAQAKVVKKHAAAVNAEAAEIKELRTQVQLLTDRLNAQEAAQQRTQSAAVAAQAAAQTAQETAQSAQTSADSQIQTIPTQVQMAVAGMPRPNVSWAANTQVSGRMYYNLSNVQLKKDGVTQAPSGAGFDIKRFYLGVDHKFNDTYSANLTYDFAYISADGATQVYLKKAYLRAKYSPLVDVKFGSTDLPWVPYAEGIYGYRQYENTLIDRTKFGTSADWGVHVSGDLPGGIFSYAVAVIDGAGYKAPLRSKTMDVEGRVSAKYKGFDAAVGGYTGKLGKSIEGNAATLHTASRFNALAAYGTKIGRVGVEYFSTENWTAVTSKASDKSEGYSLFGNYNFTEKVSLFGRYDWVKPNQSTNARLKDNYYNLGVQYSPTKIVDFALLYKRDNADNGILSTSNGSIGGVKKGTYDEFGLFGQFRF